MLCIWLFCYDFKGIYATRIYSETTRRTQNAYVLKCAVIDTVYHDQISSKYAYNKQWRMYSISLLSIILWVIVKQETKQKRKWNKFWIGFIFSQSILVIYPNNNRCVFVYVSFHFGFVCFVSFRSVSLLFRFLFYNHPYLVSHEDRSIIWILMGSIMDYMNPT